MARSDSEAIQERSLEVLGKEDQIIKRKDGGAFGAYHSYGEEKVAAFAEYINFVLADDPFLTGKLPINPSSNDLFSAVSEGILLCRLIDKAQPGIVFEKAINRVIKTVHHKVENHNLAINSAKALGCNVVNIGAQDLIAGTEHLVLGLVWQIIKVFLFRRVTLKDHPALVVLLKEGEELADLLKLSKEQILMRWVNYHLAAAGCSRTLSNFGADIKDSEIYTYLMAQICPDHCTLAPLKETDPKKRAALVLQNADKIGCRKFVTADNIVAGSSQLNLAYTALLFNTYPALELPQEQAAMHSAEFAALMEEEEAEATREESVFKNWINSMGLSSDVNNLIEDCRTGQLLVEVVEKLAPNLVNWKMVKKDTKVQIKQIENCNYAVQLATDLGLHVINVGGKDVADGNKKLVLGLVWQLMRHDTVRLLEGLGANKSKVSDSDLIAWANDKVAKCGKTGGGKISSFQDSELASGRFLLFLCHALDDGVVNWEIVTAGQTEEEKETNAKYCLSAARKMGCGVFLSWLDVVEVKPKMLMTFVGCLMALDKSRAAA